MYRLVFSAYIPPWHNLWSRFPEKLTDSQLVKKFPTFYGIQKFITMFTKACHLLLSWTRQIHSTQPNHISLRYCLLIFVCNVPCCCIYRCGNPQHSYFICIPLIQNSPIQPSLTFHITCRHSLVLSSLTKTWCMREPVMHLSQINSFLFYFDGYKAHAWSYTNINHGIVCTFHLILLESEDMKG